MRGPVAQRDMHQRVRPGPVDNARGAHEAAAGGEREVACDPPGCTALPAAMEDPSRPACLTGLLCRRTGVMFQVPTQTHLPCCGSLLPHHGSIPLWGGFF